MLRPVAALALVLAAAPVAAADIAVSAGWTRATVGVATSSAAYFRIENRGAVADRLTGVTTPVGRASLHASMTMGGMMHMAALTDVVVPAHGAVEFRPGARHVMIEGLQAPLRAGQTVPADLHFARAGTVRVPLSVRGLAD